MINFNQHLKFRPIQQQGYELLHNGVLELAIVEDNGIRVDLEQLQETKQVLSERMRLLHAELVEADIWALWRKRFGQAASFTKDDQLRYVLFTELKYQPTSFTETGKASVDEDALQKVNHPFIQKLGRYRKYKKALSTFIGGIEEELVGDRFHPCFNLHIARSFRSSCDSPNSQNFPTRDEELAELVRSLIIASSGCVIVENDFKGVEVGLSCVYHRDPVFLDYITTPGKDMHRDTAADLFFLKAKQVDKKARHEAKNKFVFPQFYGDYHKGCAPNLWEGIERRGLLGPDGQSLYEHLRRNGITGLGKCERDQEAAPGTFEYHVKEVEQKFWHVRFKGYTQWKKDWYQGYLDKGYFDLLTGFRVGGHYNRKQVCNYPVQGSAFHCLLWTLIEVNRALRHYQMKSRLVGQIHDSLLGDVVVKELRDYLDIVTETVQVKLRRHYKWLEEAGVPLEVETEIAPSNGTWHQKQPVIFNQGAFQHPENEKLWTPDDVQFVALLDQLNKNPRKYLN